MNEQTGNHATHPPATDGNASSAAPLTLSERVRSLRLPEPMTALPSARGRWLPWIGCGFFACLSIYLGIRLLAAEPASRPGARANGQPLGEAKPAPLPQGRVALEAGGYVVPVRRVQVSPKVGGEVVELFIEEGQDVKKGQILAKLDRTKYEFEYRRMQALAEQMKAEYEKVRTGNREEEKKHSTATLREAEDLRDQLKDEAGRLKRSRPASSPEELVRIESKLSQAEHKVEQLRQAHKMMHDGQRKEEVDKAHAGYLHAVAQRDNAKYDLDSTEVVAPVSGRILVKRAEVGNTVRPEAFSNGLSASLCDMADLRDLEVDVDISERDLDRVFARQVCEIRTEAFPDRVYKGQVARLMPEANRSKASVPVRVRIEVPANDELLRPEMRARVSFLAKK